MATNCRLGIGQVWRQEGISTDAEQAFGSIRRAIHVGHYDAGNANIHSMFVHDGPHPPNQALKRLWFELRASPATDLYPPGRWKQATRHVLPGET